MTLVAVRRIPGTKCLVEGKYKRTNGWYPKGEVWSSVSVGGLFTIEGPNFLKCQVFEINLAIFQLDLYSHLNWNCCAEYVRAQAFLAIV